MSKKASINEKHIEAIADKTISVIIYLFGNCHQHIQGKVTGRIRNRFKTFVFTPTFPFCYFTFSIGDVEKIEITENKGIVMTLNRIIEAPKRRRKKKKPAPVVAAEPDAVVDLSNKTETVTT